MSLKKAPMSLKKWALSGVLHSRAVLCSLRDIFQYQVATPHQLLLPTVSNGLSKSKYV